MYKAVIFYFCGTGNTWWAANKIRKLLDAQNINANTVSIDTLIDGETLDTKKADWLIKSADLIFMGWPVHGSDLPRPMKFFIDSLSPLKKQKHIHTFCTQMMFSGDGAYCYHKHFLEKGLVIDTCAHFTMPSNMSSSHGFLSPPKTDEQAQKIMDQCGVGIDKYINNLLLGKARIKGRFSYPLGISQRAPYRLLSKSMKSIMGVNKELCTKCGQCAKLCPTANITMNVYPQFNDKCALCMRCYSYCPAVAITARGKTHNTQKHGLPYRLRDKIFKLSSLKPEK